MGRHSKNNSAAPTFTYHERKELDYGTKSERIGKDGHKKFDYCGICLHPVVVPMCCGKGHLYCKECILEYLVKHKKEYEFKMEKYQELQNSKKENEKELEREKVENEIKTFDKYLGGSSTEPQNNQKQEQEKKQVQDQTNNRIKELSKYTSSEAETKIMKSVEKSATKEKRPLNNFWIQDFSENPNEKPVEMEQPKKEAKCPLGDHTIKASKLIKLVFKNNESEKQNEDLFLCPSCGNTLSNGRKSGAIKNCGHVFCLECIKNEKQCALCSVKFREKDMIKLDTSGTGFSSTTEKIVASKYTPSALFG